MYGKRPDTVICGNCGASRSVDDRWNVQECPVCHDDEYNIIVSELALEDFGFDVSDTDIIVEGGCDGML